MKKYEPKEIEPKWQAKWEEDKTYVVNLKSKKPTYIASGMFNYPSGQGIHIGHGFTFTIPDIKARFKRQSGYESLNPVGWDSFGLPAENYAIKMGVSPQKSMAEIIPGYREQYRAMGWGNDWAKEIDTSQPIYYKWSQWLFGQMYKHDMAYQDVRMQWWCEKCQTVLANEQINSDGKCWRHESPDDEIVEKKEVKQWFFKVTEYADELLEGADGLDWTDHVKIAQKNWIGRSEGINIDYEIVGSKHQVTCFTTTPVNYGMTFIVVAPEHEILKKIVSDEKKEEVEKYVKACVRKSELERMQDTKEKTGVFTGSYAINQLTGKEVPIWVADFVLASFGTGVVQGCPAHDERDFEFAKKFGIPIIRVVEGENGETKKFVDPENEKVDQVKLNHGIERKMVNSEQFNGLVFDQAMQKTMDYFVEKGWGERVVNYKMRDWSVTRQRYWGTPTPIINCGECGPVLVPDEELPVVLPELEDFKPSGDGRSALARATEWLKVDCPKCGIAAERETDTLDTFIDSSWYLYRYLDSKNEDKIFETDLANKWFPVDFYDGADHATAHLLYARFVSRFFTKIGLVDEPEPFKQMLFHGKLLASDGSNFSKTKGNGPNPLDIIKSGYGADALRTFLMFAAPPEINARWNPQGVPAAYRFLNRVWNLVQEFLEVNQDAQPEDQKIELNPEIEKQILSTSHKAVKKVTEDIENDKFNTAVAAMMEATNSFFKIKEHDGGKMIDDKNGTWRSSLMNLLAVLAPFAPHITEELWQDLGHSSTIHIDTWPKWDEKYLVSETIKIAVQINGKLKSEIEVDANAEKVDVLKTAKEDSKVAKAIEEKEIKKEIYVPRKIVNFVI
jgi:leucyl-tRNA synthetase